MRITNGVLDFGAMVLVLTHEGEIVVGLSNIGLYVLALAKRDLQRYFASEVGVDE